MRSYMKSAEQTNFLGHILLFFIFCVTFAPIMQFIHLNINKPDEICKYH